MTRLIAALLMAAALDDFDRAKTTAYPEASCMVPPADVNETDGTPLPREATPWLWEEDTSGQVRVMVAGLQKTGSTFLGAGIAAAVRCRCPNR